MDLNIVKMRKIRTIYTVLDLLSDVGGLGIALWCILAIFFTLVHYNSVENFLISQLYIQKSDQSDELLKIQ